MSSCMVANESIAERKAFVCNAWSHSSLGENEAGRAPGLLNVESHFGLSVGEKT